MRWDYTFKEQIINCRTGFYLGGAGFLFMAVFMAPAFSAAGNAALWISAVICIAVGIYGSVKSRR